MVSRSKHHEVEQEMNKLNHTVWECKYHVVFIPKYRKKSIYKELRGYLGEMFRDLANQYECKIEEGPLCPDHVHIMNSIPPKKSVSEVVGFLKGKRAIYIARNFIGKRKNYAGQGFWARGYHVSTVGRNEETIRKYIQNQETEDRRIDQLQLL
jgi:putative transposase